MSHKVGYARVSTIGQSLDVQLDKLASVGCDKVFKDKLSGTTADRPELQECLRYVREGDSLIITKLDRLARSTYHLTQIAHELASKGVDLVVLDQQIDTSTPTGKLMFNMLSSIAEFETEIRKERQLEGIAAAKAKGVKFGRKKALDEQQMRALRIDKDSGMLVKDLMSKYGLKKTAVYKYLKMEEEQRALDDSADAKKRVF